MDWLLRNATIVDAGIRWPRVPGEDDEVASIHRGTAGWSSPCLLHRADETDIRWGNREHRDDPPELEPHTGWAHGKARNIRELSRYRRISRGGESATRFYCPTIR